MANFSNPMKVITGPNTRWSYANVWEAKSINGGTPKYSVSLIIPKSDTVTVEKIKKAIQVRVNLRAMARQYLHSLYLRLLFVKEIWSVQTMRLMPTATSSMQILQQHLVLWMQTKILLLTAVRFTVVYMAEHLSIFMHLIPTATRVLPVVLTIFRRLRTESRLVVSQEQRMILQQTRTMLS